MHFGLSLSLTQARNRAAAGGSYVRTAFLSTGGNDGTAELNNASLPFLTQAAAVAALISAYAGQAASARFLTAGYDAEVPSYADMASFSAFTWKAHSGVIAWNFATADWNGSDGANPGDPGQPGGGCPMTFDGVTTTGTINSNGGAGADGAPLSNGGAGNGSYTLTVINHSVIAVVNKNGGNGGASGLGGGMGGNGGDGGTINHDATSSVTSYTYAGGGAGSGADGDGAAGAEGSYNLI